MSETATVPGISSQEAAAREVVARALEAREDFLTCKRALDIAEDAWRAIERVACEAMDLADLSSVRFDGIGLVVRSTRHAISVGDRETLFAALDEEGVLEELTYQEYRKAALRERVLARLKAGAELWPGIEYLAVPYITVRSK